MESVLRRTMYEMPSNPQIRKAVVDRDEVDEASELIVREILDEGAPATETPALDERPARQSLS